MRAFIGIDFSSNVKNSILDIQNQLKKYCPKARWKYVDNFHITLKFLDEIDDKTVELINKQMNDVIENQKAFKLNLLKIGAFKGGGFRKGAPVLSGSQESLRVLWLGFSGELDTLKQLQKNVEQSLETIGIEKENRAYTPHLTIAQDVIIETDLSDVEKHISLSEIEDITADRMYLYKSEQIGKNRVYTKVYEYIFKGNN